jgi:tellurite resistance protein TerC
LLYFWIAFNAFALLMLVIDLRVFHRPGHVIQFREALGWSLMYVAQAAAFAAILYFWQGRESSLEFVAGYVVELSLSVDNLFVFLVIFNYFAVPEEQQHRVLFWGILGALILRGIFIGAGVGLIHRFHWLLYLFGALLIYSGIRVCISGEHQVDPASNPVVKMLRKWIPVTTEYRNGRFFVRNPQENGRLYATPLLVVLLVIETTDVLFAVDSIPAVLAITLKAFIVYTSNVFAILGLRSMFFAVAGLMKLFRFLHYGLAVILILVGAKMLLGDYIEIPIGVTLGSVAAVLVVAIAVSLAYPKPADPASN